MARKSNQKKKATDLQGSNSTKRRSESQVNGHGEASEAKVFPVEELPNSKNDNVGDKQKSKSNGVNGTDQSNSLGNDSAEANESNENTEFPSVAKEKTVPRFDKSRIRSRSNRQSRSHFLLNGIHIYKALGSLELPDNVVTRSLKTWGLLIFKRVNEWMERYRPLFSATKSKIDMARSYGKAKFDVAYPIVLKWLMNIGSIMFLLLVIWLDSAVRGIDSFFRMGTSSFFSVIWCSIFSVIAMAGFFKFLAVLAISALLGVFVGFSLGMLIVGFAGAVFMWLYGSFWTTSFVILLGGLAYALSYERIALLITTVYSVYCAWAYVGWLGLVVAFNIAFVSSDGLIYFLKNSASQQKRHGYSSEQTQDQNSFFNGEHSRAFPPETSSGFSADRGPGVPSTSGADSELTSDDEIVRLLNCSDHYSVLGLTRFEIVDVSLLKREYRKKAMLVHPDKNMGNEKAVEAFKKLQNAYEVLLDSAKQKSYDDELRKEELLNIFRRFKSTPQMNGRHGFFASGMAPSEADGEDPVGESRQIACKKCNDFHVWVLTRKSKSRARWCQECKEFHQAKDGDGWVEQSSQPLLFGLLQKVDPPAAFVCADSRIFDASEWYICQGMRCASNTHKPSFHVNTSVTSKAPKAGQRGGAWMPNMEDCVNEEEFFEWFQSAVQAGVFDNNINVNMNAADSPTAKPQNSTPKTAKRKKKGKNQW